MSKRSVRPSAAPSVATFAPPPPPSSTAPLPPQMQMQPAFLPFAHHCHVLNNNGASEDHPLQPLYLDGINHCPECNPKHLVDFAKCHHDLRLSRVSGRPLRRRDAETLEDYTLRVNEVFKVCPLEREWTVATTNYFKMDFFHTWLEGLRSKYMTSIVLSMDAASTPESNQLTVEKAVSTLRQIARQEDLIRQMETRRGGRVTPPHVLDPFVLGGVGADDRPTSFSKWNNYSSSLGMSTPKKRVNENSQFVRIVKVNPGEHDQDDLDADGNKLWH